MSSLEEQLALFEKELSSAVESGTKCDLIVSDGVSKFKGPIQAHEVDGSLQALPTTTTKFVPHQLTHKMNHQPAPVHHHPHLNHPIGNLNIRFPMASLHTGDTAVIESGPTFYALPTSSSKVAASVSKKTAPESPVTSATPPPISIQQQQSQPGYKTLALPSDVELLLAKKQASKAHENSYLGAVLRGEKKMKRFLRSCGGQAWEDSSMAEWDPNDFRIFCGDLGNEVSDELLAKAFRKYGSFQKAKVVRDSRTNKSKGYGFVSFKNQEDFIRAMKEMDGKYVGNRPIKLRKSNWKDRNMDIVKKKNKEKKKLGLL